MRASFPLLSVAFLSLLAGCGDPQDTASGTGGTAGSTSTAGGGSGGGGASAGETFEFDTDPYTLASGQERNYMCFTTRLPADAKMFVTEIEPIYGKAIHHLAISQTISDEPEGTFDCPELSKDSWLPVYLGGVDSTPLKMPAGSAAPLPKGAQILVQLHLLNATADSITDKAHIIFHTSKEKGLTGAGVFGIDNRDILIPAHGKDVIVEQSCPSIGRDMDVFAVFGHMHQLGTKIEVSRGATPGEDVLYTQDWVFQDQPTVATKFHIAKTDQINVRCWFDNPGDTDVVYGESSFTEMCAFILYHTPFGAVGGCVKAPPK